MNNWSFFRKNKSVLCIVVIAFLVRALYFAAILIMNPEGFWQFDSYGYHQLAQNLIDLQQFSRSSAEPYYPDSFRTPAYPFYIALFYTIGAGVKTIIFTQLILSACICGLVYMLTNRIFQHKKAAIAASAFVIFDVPSIVLSNYLLTETLFCFLFLLSVFLFITALQKKSSGYPLMFSGVLLGLAVLCRPVATFAFALFIATLLFGYRHQLLTGLKKIVVFCLPLLLILSPWLIRNQNTFNTIFISTSGHLNICSWHAANIYAQKEGIGIHNAQKKYWKELYDQYPGTPTPENIKYSEFIAAKSFEVLKNNPFLAVKQQLQGITHLLFKPMRGYIDHQLGLKKGYNPVSTAGGKSIIKKLFNNSSDFTIALVFFQTVLLLIAYISFVPGYLQLVKMNKFVFLFFFTICILYFINMTLPPITYARMRIPVLPIIAIISGPGYYQLLAFFQNKRMKSGRF